MSDYVCNLSLEQLDTVYNYSLEQYEDEIDVPQIRGKSFKLRKVRTKKKKQITVEQILAKARIFHVLNPNIVSLYQDMYNPNKQLEIKEREEKSQLAIIHNIFAAQFVCKRCKKSFGTMQGLKSHRGNVHK
jgi:hypothetical protein